MVGLLLSLSSVNVFRVRERNELLSPKARSQLMLSGIATSFDSSTTACFGAEKNEVKLLLIDFAALLA